MRKFNHEKALEIAFDIVYVASFIALIAFITTNAKGVEVIDTTSEEYFYGNEDCMNCDEID
jgi:hypothetical protein